MDPRDDWKRLKALQRDVILLDGKCPRELMVISDQCIAYNTFVAALHLLYELDLFDRSDLLT